MRTITACLVGLILLNAQSARAETEWLDDESESYYASDFKAEMPESEAAESEVTESEVTESEVNEQEFVEFEEDDYGCSECQGDGECGCDSDRWNFMPQSECGVNIHGWIDAVFMGNTDSPTSRYNGPYNAVDRSNEAVLNQMYLVTEKGLPLCGTGFGFRADFLYGGDYFLAESIGMEKRPDGSARWNPEDYGLAIPQAYVSAGNQDFSIQAGHFYSIVGYEGVMSPDNFFYSKAYSYQFAGPFTHWGAQMNWKVNDQWTVQAGAHNGWDALDRETDDIGVIGKVRYDSCSGWWSSLAATSGKEFNNPANRAITNGYTNRSRYSWLVGAPLTRNLEYVFHHYLGFQADGAPGNNDALWYGIDQYLYYTINDCWKAGVRMEWFNDDDGTRVGLNRPSNPNDAAYVGDFYSVSVGLNWMPTANLTIRPEFRADWFDGETAALPFDDGNSDAQYLFGIDGVFTF